MSSDITGKAHSQSYYVWQRLKTNKGAMIGLIFLCILLVLMISADFLFDYNEVVIKQKISERKQPPSKEHWFGTDESGRDILARVVHGSRRSVLISACAVLGATLVGGALGAVAGFYGGKIGEVIMRCMDMLMAIPSLLLGLVIVSCLGSSIPNLMLAVGIGAVPRMARILRSSVMTCRSADYVEAARARGATNNWILLKHILPNSISPIFVQVTVQIGTTILILSSLSFLGLGVQPPTPEWGAMLSSARTYIRDCSYMCLFPGLAILFTILSLNLLGDGLRDALDPKLK